MYTCITCIDAVTATVNGLVFVMETQCVFCEVGAEFSYIVTKNVSQLRRLFPGLSPRRPGLNPSPLHMGCWVNIDAVALPVESVSLCQCSILIRPSVAGAVGSISSCCSQIALGLQKYGITIRMLACDAVLCAWLQCRNL